MKNGKCGVAIINIQVGVLPEIPLALNDWNAAECGNILAELQPLLRPKTGKSLIYG